MKKKLFRKRQKRNKPAEDQRLALLAKELGVAIMMVLVNDYDFSQDEADLALGKVLAQAQENRAMITTSAVVAAYDSGKIDVK
jgi:membrane-anchored protein YejM (alkaline phosphatase superfamily)